MNFVNDVYAQEPFVAIIEFGFSEEYLDSIEDQVVQIENMPEWCSDYTSHAQMKIDDIEKHKRHGDKVISNFLDFRTDQNIKVLPISIPDAHSPGSSIEVNFASVFYCLKELVPLGLKGVNFSTTGYERQKEDLDIYEEHFVEQLNAFVEESIRFLDERSVIITAALGNEIDRLENLVSVPLISLCTKNWENVKCVTSVEDRVEEYGTSYSWGDRLTYTFFNPPDGTQEEPFLVNLRYAASENVVAVPQSYEISKYTSFLAPYVLARSFEGYTVENVHAYVLPVEGTRLELVQVPLITD